MDADCSGGCGRKKEKDWYELWCPSCYNYILQSYQRPADFHEAPVKSIPPQQEVWSPVKTVVGIIVAAICLVYLI
uniref:Uncharacterized protein n=1 Tax=viral metagenome TaxID=1070528 RepID=A0A6C0CGW5_9ZZZZ